MKTKGYPLQTCLLATLLLAPPAAMKAQFAFQTMQVPYAESGLNGGSYALGISGTDIVGGYIGTNGSINGFHYANGAYTTLNDPNSGYGTVATGISGTKIVGWYSDGNSYFHGFVYNGSYFTNLDDPNAVPLGGNFFPVTPPGGDSDLLNDTIESGQGGTVATGISGANIVGWYADEYGLVHGFLFNGSSFKTLDDPNGVGATYPQGISGNNIVGWYVATNGSSHGFLYNGSTYTTLDDPNGVGVTYPQGISGNNIVGYYTTNVTAGDGIGGHSFLYNGSSYIELDDPSAYDGAATSAQGISGTNVVGWYFNTNVNTYGFFATPVSSLLQFTASPTNGEVPLTVQFNAPSLDSLGNTITSWNWNFGDGGTTNAQNPSHTYTTVGTFTPNLFANDNQGNLAAGFGLQIVTAPVPLSVTIQPTNSIIAVGTGSSVTLAVSVEGTGPFSYQWQKNGTNLPNGIITTVAGGGSIYPNDGGAATNAELDEPEGVAIDANGNLFIVDELGDRVRKVGINGIITTVAGNGTSAYSGDGGAATNAELNYPWGVAVDAGGNFFIGDQDNERVRRVGANGIITTVAGNGYKNSSPYGGGGYSGDGGAATNAELYWPLGVVVDATDNLFIADYGNSRIRKVDTNGIISTVAGNGLEGDTGDGGIATNAELNGPYMVTVDTNGNLFIAEPDGNRVRKVGTNGLISTVAGNGAGAGSGGYGNYFSGDGGMATNAELNLPQAVAVDTAGNLYIADSENQRIRKVDSNGIITTFAGNGTNGYLGDGGMATNAELSLPVGVAVDATGNLFITDLGNGRIRKVANNTGSTLVLNNVGLGNAGAYDVVVSNPYGSVTSSVVNVTVTLLPVILSAPQMSIGNTNFTFLLSGPAGSNYVLQASTNLLNWSLISTSSLPVSGSISVSNAVNGYSRRFYRAYLH